MLVRRYDAGSLRPPERTPEGFLIVDGLIARTGVQVYRKADGTEIREYRPADEVFDAEAIASFDLRPVTNNHPPELLTADNAKSYAVGAVGSPRRDGRFIAARLAIHDASAIEALLAGRAQLSCGYEAEVDMTSGVSPEGERYDAIQRRIRGNHVALVDVARAGPEARVRLDAGDAECITPAPSSAVTEETHMKIRIDGIELDATDASVIQSKIDALESAKKDAEAARDAAQAKADAEKSRADEAAEAMMKCDACAGEGKVDGKTCDKCDGCGEMPKAAKADGFGKWLAAKLDSAVRARVALEVEARKHLGADAKLDGVSDLDVRRQVIGKLAPECKLDGRTEAYILARYDAEVERAKPAPAVDQARQVLADSADRKDAASPRQKMINEMRARSAPKAQA